MNRGNIPGFYYDEERQRYFPVTADSAAPKNAKFARSNVDAERRKSKKRKLDYERQKLVRKQTVPTAKILKHPLLGGAGLLREHGNTSQISKHQGTAFVNGLEAREVRVGLQLIRDTSLTDVVYVPRASKAIIAMRLTANSHAVYAADWNFGHSGNHAGTEPHAMHAFYDPISSIHTTEAHGKAYVVATTKQPNPIQGNVFVSPVVHSYDDGIIAASHCFNVGKAGDTLWDCAVRSDRIAIAATHGCEIHHIDPNVQDHPINIGIKPERECYAVTFLDERTLAIGTRHLGRKTASHRVMLWDTRSEGAALRFERQYRVSGVHSIGAQRLLVSSSRDISLYDLRVLKKNRPLLQLDHYSGVTTLPITVLDNDLLAAVNQYNELQVYSLRSGKHVRALYNCNERRGQLLNPRWQEHVETGAPYLQACLGDTLQQWTWAEGPRVRA